MMFFKSIKSFDFSVEKFPHSNEAFTSERVT
jgi:hypothetical protein